MKTILIGLLLLPFAVGCGEARPEVAPTTRAVPLLPQRFSAATAGTIRGRVAWEGPIPRPAPYRLTPGSVQGDQATAPARRDNPNAPLIDPQRRAVGNAVVFLRGVDVQHARPWDHETVQVEMIDYQIRIGPRSDRPAYGFVRRGDAIGIVSRMPVFQSLHADGASFFSLTFPDPNEPISRRLDQRGVVELTSSAGYFWMRGYLFVDDHPYFARTHTDGTFELPGVPPGDYDLVCWMPNWIEERRNRDPESGLVTRIFYRRPVEIVKKVHVGAKDAREVDFTVAAAAFER